jgi:Uma2 family endonuclease
MATILAPERKVKTLTLTPTQRATYADYRALDVDDNFFYELLQGELVKKAAPSPLHQMVVANLYDALNAVVKPEKLGKVLFAPIDVFIDDQNAPQPDVLFIAEQNKHFITKDGIFGAPDIVVEVLSPSSVMRDRITKMKLYAAFGVPEYWIIDLNNTTVEIYRNTSEGFELHSFAVENGTVQSFVLQEFMLDVGQLFAE